ncbi:MAG: DUF4189 domain-containing protein [Curvibacter sp.]|nr:DUF4189 domain-containing protein [Curvibacter sp.]
MLKIKSLVAATIISLIAPISAFAIGAIAVDDADGDSASDVGYNVVGGFDSESSAKNAALKACRDAGNKNCKIGVWYKRCGAYASSKEANGWGTGGTKAEASQNALDGCGGGCKIVVADCEE